MHLGGGSPYSRGPPGVLPSRRGGADGLGLVTTGVAVLGGPALAPLLPSAPPPWSHYYGGISAPFLLVRDTLYRPSRADERQPC